MNGGEMSVIELATVDVSGERVEEPSGLSGRRDA